VRICLGAHCSTHWRLEAAACWAKKKPLGSRRWQDQAVPALPRMLSLVAVAGKEGANSEDRAVVRA
jgi:hypothetical protein